MNDPKLLQKIAEKACIFDKAHFDDDTSPTPDALLSNHERLPSDRKLITRLRPRYAVALGYFEGYAQATSDTTERTEILRSNIASDGKRMTALVEWERKVLELAEVSPAHDFPRTTALARLREMKEQKASLERERNELRARVNEMSGQLHVQEQNIGIVQKPPPPPPPPASFPKENELSAEIDDVLARAAAEYANAFVEDPSESTGASDEPRRWVRLHALRDGAVFETKDGIRAVKSEYHYPNGGIECVLVASGEYAHFGDTPEKHNDVLVRQIVIPDRQAPPGTEGVVRTVLVDLAERMGDHSLNVEMTQKHLLDKIVEFVDYLREYQPIAPKDEPRRDFPVAPEPIVFRSDDERDFWDEQVHALNRRGDRSSRDVANAADEMVEERRRRMRQVTTSDPIEFAKAVHDRIVALGHGCSWSKESGRVYMRLWSGAKQLSILDVDEMIATDRTTDDAVDLLLAHAPKPDEAKEVTDELLLEATAWANECLGMQPTKNDIKRARLVSAGSTDEWLVRVHGYVSGVLRKARKA